MGFVDGFGLPFIERLHHFGWLRWVAKVIAITKVVDEVKTKKCSGLHAADTQVIN